MSVERYVVDFGTILSQLIKGLVTERCVFMCFVDLGSTDHTRSYMIPYGQVIEGMWRWLRVCLTGGQGHQLPRNTDQGSR